MDADARIVECSEDHLACCFRVRWTVGRIRYALAYPILAQPPVLLRFSNEEIHDEFWWYVGETERQRLLTLVDKHRIAS